MNGGCRSLGSLGKAGGPHTLSACVLLLLGVLGCGGDQRSGAAPADTSQAQAVDTSATPSDTAAAPRRDSVPPAARADSTVAPRDTGQRVAAKPPQKPPARKPPAPARPPRTDTSTAATPAQPPRSDTSAAATPAQPDTAVQTARPDTAAVATPPADTTSGATEVATQTSPPLRDQYHRAPLDTVPQQVYDGWKQYNLNCARCHGEDVLGTTIAPHLIVSLKPEGPVNTKELFVQTVCEGRPAKGMPAWCPLGMERPTIEAIYAYVKGRSDAKLRPGRPALRAGG
jgi:Cytochrome C oxidase, cbb3-type, subunit III